MQYKNEGELKAALKAGQVQSVYLLYGTESYLIEYWSSRITGRFGKEFSSFNMQKLDGRNLDCGLLYEAVEMLPLMAQEKCVFVDGLEPSKLPGGELDRLLDIIRDIPPDCVLVITGKPPGFDEKSVAAKKLVKCCADMGAAVRFGVPEKQDLAVFLRKSAKKQGCELSVDLAKYILQTCETDMHALKSEMAKICAFAGGGRLERKHIDAVAVPRVEARVFDLNKAILAGNPQRAMEILRDLFYLREQPASILAVLVMAYADLYRARAARDEGKTPADVVAMFGYKGREFRVNNAFNSRLTARGLRVALDCLLECDLRIKSTPVDDRILLEQAVVRLIAVQG